MLRRDEVYLRQMREYCSKAIDKTIDVEPEQFFKDEDLQLILVHLVQMIGEAARRVSPELQELHSEIPWSNIIGMRHKLVHDYFDVNYRVVWNVATEGLPDLLRKIDSIIPPETT